MTPRDPAAPRPAPVAPRPAPVAAALAPCAPRGRRALPRTAVALAAALLLAGCGDDSARADDVATPGAPTPPAAPSPPAREDAIKSSEWWARAEEAFAQVTNADNRSWNQAYFAVCLEYLDRSDEAEARAALVEDPNTQAFALERLALSAWRRGDRARFDRLRAELDAAAPLLADTTPRAYHHGLLFALHVAAGDFSSAEAAWYASRGDPEPNDALRKEQLSARLAVQAGLGQEQAWLATWDEIYDVPPDIHDHAALFRGLLFVGESERVTTLLAASMQGALGPGGTQQTDQLYPAQRLVADWARDGFADEALPIWEALDATRSWPAEVPPPAELGQALARADRLDDAQALAARMPPAEAARVHDELAVAYERAGAAAAADALLERVDLAPSDGLRVRRLIARAERERTPESRAAATDLLLEVEASLPPSEGDALGALVSVLVEADDRAQLERVVDRFAPRFRVPEALPSLAALTAGTGLDHRVFHALEQNFAGETQPAAMLYALAALAARDGHLAELPPSNLGLRVDQVVAALALGIKERGAK